MDLANIRKYFPGLHNAIYFNTATCAIGNVLARQAYDNATQDWLNGTFDFKKAEDAGEDSRRIFSSLIGASKNEIALVPAVSEAAGRVAAQFPEARTGENILLADCEFTSNYFPWVLLKKKGYEIRIVETKNGILSIDAFHKLADSRTKLIAVSAVQSLSGFRIDLDKLASIAKKNSSLLFVDASQAAGALPINVKEQQIDLLATVSHKFLLGTRGMGYFYIKDELLDIFEPLAPGWKAAADPFSSFYGPEMKLSNTASKFDVSLAWFPALAEKASLQIIEQAGLNSIYERNDHLANFFIEKLGGKDLPFKGFRPSNRSTIFSIPIKNEKGMMKHLNARNVIASVRGGNLRLSIHFYNTEKDIDAIIEIIGDQYHR